MIVTTELAKYHVDEIARGKFKLTTLEVLVPIENGRRPCYSGRWAYHETVRCEVGRSSIVHGLVLRRGANFTFSASDLLPTPYDSCCGFTNLITDIEP